MSSRLDLFHPNPVKRAEAQHNDQESGKWNYQKKEEAKKQFQNPIKGLINSVKNSALGLIRGTGNLAGDLSTQAIAAVSNYAQLAWDAVAKTGSRAFVIGADTVSKGIGTVSIWAKEINDKIHKALEPKAAGHGAHGTAHGAHGAAPAADHGAAAGHGGGHAPAAHH
ncbi:MAG: hypothetical protein WCX95_02325 [Candidatus Gracilibacteria bacterium]